MTTLTPASASTTLDSINPATGEVVGTVPLTPIAEIPAIVARARAAAKDWAALTPAQRADILRPAGQALMDRSEKLGRLLSREQGKPFKDGIGEVQGCGHRLSDEVDEIAAAVQPQVLTGEGVESTIHHDPYGVCAAITPWNFPMLMPHWMALPALVTGNTVILKPSEETPLIAQAYADVLSEFLPVGVLQVVHGREQGPALVHADVDLIAFTGSKATGQAIMRAAADGLKRVILELGSKDPLLVLEGADLDKAAEFAARNSFRNCGQVCVSTERIYVDRRLHAEFIAKLVEQAAAFTVGPCDDESAVIGPMIHAKQKAHVTAQIADAVSKGAKVVFGNQPRDGNFITPTVLDGVTHAMDIMTTETFGPVACVMAVDSSDEAVELANDSEYGLGAAVYGEESLARSAARRLTAGMIGVNRGIGGAPGMPWVGARQSGIGYHAGPMGHRQFCQVRVVSRNA
ncbi:MAG: aldehyde dehydrogenase family protein [Phycisphaerales bacterium]|nr:aldehyde dehydrogenase [Planctomycetota bacterium]MCH8509838.1 aldehyde dehydrogenase family protein [Phycisphaerales bacterium]